MRTAQWLFLTLLATVLTLGGLHMSARRAEAGADPRRPEEGRLAPVLEPGPPMTEKARLRRSPGPIVDLAADGPRVAVLTRRGWFITNESGVESWHGEEIVGAPHWLSGAEAIALKGDRVYILEPQRSILSVWDENGVRRGEISIPVRRDLAQRGTEVLLGPSGRPVVVLQGMDQDGTAYWEILELDSNGQITGMVSLPSKEETAIYQEPKLAVRGPALLSMSSLSQELWAVDLAHGELHPVAVREAPPLWTLPREERRKHRELLARMPGTMARVARLPEYWPPVRDFTVLKDGTVVQVTAAGEETVQLERLTTRLEPLGRANSGGFSHPVFLSRGRVFVVEDRTEETVVYELFF